MTTKPQLLLLNFDTRCSCKGCSSLSHYLVCSYYVATGENIAWEKICKRQSVFDELFPRIYNLFVTTPRIGPIEGTIY